MIQERSGTSGLPPSHWLSVSLLLVQAETIGNLVLMLVPTGTLIQRFILITWIMQVPSDRVTVKVKADCPPPFPSALDTTLTFMVMTYLNSKHYVDDIVVDPAHAAHLEVCSPIYQVIVLIVLRFGKCCQLAVGDALNQQGQEETYPRTPCC